MARDNEARARIVSVSAGDTSGLRCAYCQDGLPDGEAKQHRGERLCGACAELVVAAQNARRPASTVAEGAGGIDSYSAANNRVVLAAIACLVIVAGSIIASILVYHGTRDPWERDNADRVLALGMEAQTLLDREDRQRKQRETEEEEQTRRRREGELAEKRRGEEDRRRQEEAQRQEQAGQQQRQRLEEEAHAKPLEISDIGVIVVDSTPSMDICTYSWKATITNRTASSVTLSVILTLYDDEGYELESDYKFGVVIGVRESKVVTGQSMTKLSTFNRATKFGVSIQ